MTKTTLKALDYTIIETSDGWEIWTPNGTGACIGDGTAKTTAIQDTIDRLRGTITLLEEELKILLR